MAVVQLDPNLLALHGRVGDVVYKTYRDKIVATRVPRFDGYVPTPAQRTQRTRMQAATAYAKRIYAYPAAKAVYIAAAQKLGRNAFRLAVSDYLKGCPRIAFRSELETRRPSRVERATPQPTSHFRVGTRRPRRVRLSPRRQRHSSPSRPLRSWRETFRTSAGEPPRPVRQALGLEPVETACRTGRASPTLVGGIALPDTLASASRSPAPIPPPKASLVFAGNSDSTLSMPRIGSPPLSSKAAPSAGE